MQQGDLNRDEEQRHHELAVDSPVCKVMSDPACCKHEAHITGCLLYSSQAVSDRSVVSETVMVDRAPAHVGCESATALESASQPGYTCAWLPTANQSYQS